MDTDGTQSMVPGPWTGRAHREMTGHELEGQRVGTLKVSVWDGYWPNMHIRGLGQEQWDSQRNAGSMVTYRRSLWFSRAERHQGRSRLCPLPPNPLSLEQNLAKQAGGSRMKWVDR